MSPRHFRQNIGVHSPWAGQSSETGEGGCPHPGCGFSRRPIKADTQAEQKMYATFLWRPLWMSMNQGLLSSDGGAVPMSPQVMPQE